VQGSAHFPGALLGVARPGVRQRRLARHRDERVDLGVVDLNPREAGVHEIGRRHAARSNAGRGFGQRQRGQRIRRSGRGRHLRARLADRAGRLDARRRGGRRAENGSREFAAG